MVSSSKIIAIGFLIGLFFGLASSYFSFYYLNLNFINNSFEKVELKEIYDTLQVKHKELNFEFNDLENDYNNLQGQYNNLTEGYETLIESYNYLQKEYSIEKALCIGNSLESYYDFLRQEIGPTGTKKWWTFSENYWQTAVDFAANLARHDLRMMYWPAIEEKYYEDVGEYSYDTAREKIEEILNLLEIPVESNAIVKLDKILDFVHRHIHFETEINDIFFAPVETLGLKSGDCDDFSILTAALLKASGINSAIGFFMNEEKQYHAMVLIQLDGFKNQSYYYFSDLTFKGLNMGTWTIIEPQLPIEDQNSEWIAQWNLIVTSPIEQN